MNKKPNEKKKIYRSTWYMDYYFMRHLRKLLKPLDNPAFYIEISRTQQARKSA